MDIFELHFEIQPTCLLHCKHCSSATINGRLNIGYSAEDIIHLINLVPYPIEVYFTGGEPLLYPNLCDLLKKIKTTTNSCSMCLFTTGIILQNGVPCPVTVSMLQELKEMNLKICYFSLYSNDPVLHDYMTNEDGSFNNTIEAIKNTIEVGIEARINLVVTKFNVEHLTEITQFACSLGVSEIRLLKLIKHGNAIKYWDEIGIDDTVYADTVRRVLSLKENIPIRITVSGLPEMVPCRPIFDASACQAGIRLLYTTYSGGVYPCACVKNREDLCIGHISQKDKLKIYVNTQTNSSRKDCLSMKGV